MTGGEPRPLEVFPRARGAWLVRWGNRRFLVPPALGRSLRDGGRPAWLEGLGAAPEGGGRPIWGRTTLLPERMTTRLSECLSAWTRGSALAAMAVFGLAALIRADFPPTLPAGPGPWIAAFGLVLGTAVWHELGHAAGLRREGLPPGRIGAGVLFVIPVLWADVTAVAALPRAGRLRVDLAGVCFQLFAAGLLAAGSGLPGPAGPVLGAAAWGAAAACAWSLFPFLRTDGYWILCDLLGLRTLDRPPPAGSPRPLAWFVALYRVANILFLVAVVATLPWRAHGLAFDLARRAGLDPRGPGPRIAAGVVTAVLVAGFGGTAWQKVRRLAGKQ
jgi:hypothetical protein